MLRNLVRCWAGEVEIGQHVALAIINEPRQLCPFRPQLIGDMAQHCARLGPVGLQKRLAQGAATTLCWVLVTWARALRIQCKRQRCQATPNTRRIAAFSPHGIRDHQLDAAQAAPHQAYEKLDQKVSASDGPICSPTISRRPSLLAATAIIAATETNMAAPRCFR